MFVFKVIFLVMWKNMNKILSLVNFVTCLKNSEKQILSRPIAFTKNIYSGRF